MTQLLNPNLQVGDFAPNCILPNGTHLFELRGHPVVLAFAPDEWNPSHAYQSEIFARLSQEFNEDAAFIDTATDDWRSLDSQSTLAAQFGVENRRALFLLDEVGVLRWKITVEPGEEIRPGQVLAALESLKAPLASKSLASESPAASGLSRRAFLSAVLAAAAVLSLPSQADAAPTADPTPGRAGATTATGYDRAGTIPISLKVNGQVRRLQLETRVALLDALREYSHLTGTKKGCDHGQCGACTVHIDGKSQLSCLMLAVMSQSKEITTIEGLSSGEQLHPVQAAFIKHDAFQCGYCTPGQIMAASALIKDGKTRSEAEIREAMSGNLCRCAAYPNIIAAVKEAQSA